MIKKKINRWKEKIEEKLDFWNLELNKNKIEKR